MFSVLFLKGNKTLLEREFKTLQEANDFINGDFEFSCEYQIYDKDKDDIIDEGDIENSNDIIEGINNMMFPEEESKEGYDWDKE